MHAVSLLGLRGAFRYSSTALHYHTLFTALSVLALLITVGAVVVWGGGSIGGGFRSIATSRCGGAVPNFVMSYGKRFGSMPRS